MRVNIMLIAAASIGKHMSYSSYA